MGPRSGASIHKTQVLAQVLNNMDKLLQTAIHHLTNFSLWSSVRYQGYVCPGILVTLAGEEEVSFLQSAWESYSILCPQDLSILRFVKDYINETQKWISSDWGSHRDVQ